jgi:hypothetical protein
MPTKLSQFRTASPVAVIVQGGGLNQPSRPVVMCGVMYVCMYVCIFMYPERGLMKAESEGRMTRNKKDQNLAASLRDLAAVGSPVDLSVAEVDLEVEQVGGVHDTMVFDLEDGHAGYVLDLLITNQMPKPFCCRDIEPRMSWPDSEFEWLQDPKEMERDPHNYRFPGRAALELPRDLALNHVLLGGGILKPGCPKQGWLLGIGSPVPANLRHGAWVEMTLAIIAYDHAEHQATITLWVDRTTKLTRKSATTVPRQNLRAEGGVQALAFHVPSQRPNSLGPIISLGPVRAVQSKV